MRCPRCDRENPESARFCNGCGAPLRTDEGEGPTLSFAPSKDRAAERPGPDTDLFHGGMTIGGRYRLDTLIGHGAFGVVFDATDTRTQERVAVKFLNIFLLMSGEDSHQVRERFQREWTAGSKLDHPGIARNLDVGQERGLPYIVMEYVSGDTLGKILEREGAQSIRKVVDIVTELLSALAHAHYYGIIHRDVKPSNIIIDRKGHLRLMDFGVAKLVDTVSTGQLTQTGLMGTPSYMSPEQASGGKIDHRSDLFSVGVLAYELLTGRRAFPGPPTVVMTKIISEPVRLPEGLAAPLREWLEKACARDAAARYGSAVEMRDALVEAAAKVPEEMAVHKPSVGELDVPLPTIADSKVTAREEDPPAGDGGPRRRSRARWVGVAAAGLGLSLLALGIGWLLVATPTRNEQRPALRESRTAGRGSASPTQEQAVAPSPPPPEEEPPLRRGRRLFESGDFEEAGAEFAEVLVKDPQNPEALDYLFRIKRLREQRPEGVRGIKVSELRLQAIDTPSGGERSARFLGPDGKTYSLTVGTRLHDGFVKTVDPDRVLLVARSPHPFDQGQEREIEVRP